MAAQMQRPVPGQRWVSDSEPEMGLGIILKSEFGRVEIFFPAADEHRQYALQSAPLRRVRFDAGDRILTHDGAEAMVESVGEKNGMLTYQVGGGRAVTEAELSDSISFSKPEDRLAGGQTDDLHTFDLRVESLYRRCAMRKSPVRGFVGGRVDMIPHQMFIAGEVSKRLVPRVLLADEVGLGKTIEAGLILHRLHLTGRADRVLILVPEPLIHQWFVELLRRFNLLFSIFDEERCKSIEENDPETNPFLDSQLVLCSLAFLAGNPGRTGQAVEASWEMVIVDEAHHLEWHPEKPSIQYRLVEQLARNAPGLLLLTATPHQLGPEGHFARLRLLDPDRYSVLERFLEETRHYGEVASAVDRLLLGGPLEREDAVLFGGKSAGIARHCESLAAGDESARGKLIRELMDEFGTGRVLFRNTRAALTGFPGRKALLAPLPGGDSMGRKLKWLADLLKDLGEEKVLAICRTPALAREVHEGLQREINVKSALFHEELTLLQRDRNAAFFAEEDGARILICSEIGSEGRNFQFAHHLVLFDLPEDPELLEQRIGRLDRIGQTGTISIHVPFVKGSESELLARWYHEGLNAFERSLHGATEIAQSFSAPLAALRKEFDRAALKDLIAESRVRRDEVAEKLSHGHDRLLELSSCRPEEAAFTIAEVRNADADGTFEEFLIGLLDHFGLHIEELGDRSYLLRPGNLLTDAFPALPDEGLSVTFDRARALSRDDIGFVSFDHPIVRSAIDLLLGSESGNVSFGIWEAPGKGAILLEVYFVAESVAPAVLHVDRFLPATPIRVLIDHALNDRSGESALKKARLHKGNVFAILDKVPVKRDLLPSMIEAAQKVATAQMAGLVESALSSMETQLEGEIERLEDLRAMNDHVRADEIDGLNAQRKALGDALRGARLRLDAVRLIWRKP